MKKRHEKRMGGVQRVDMDTLRVRVCVSVRVLVRGFEKKTENRGRT